MSKHSVYPILVGSAQAGIAEHEPQIIVVGEYSPPPAPVPPPIILNDLFPPYDLKVKNSHKQGKIPYSNQFAKRKKR